MLALEFLLALEQLKAFSEIHFSGSLNCVDLYLQVLEIQLPPDAKEVAVRTLARGASS
jgi:hypothetical protein